MKELGHIPAATGEWECAECGYVEDGLPARRPKECPDCNAPEQAFEFFPYDDANASSWDDLDEADDEDPSEDFDDEDAY